VEIAAVATEVAANVVSSATSLNPGKMVSSVSNAGAAAIAVLGSAAKKVAKLGKGALKVLDPLTKFGAEGLNSGERRVLRAMQNKNETKDSITETAQTVAEMTGALAKSVVSVGYEAVSSPFEVYDGIVYGSKSKIEGGNKLRGGETNDIDWNKFHSYKNKDY
jgi:phage-related protein